MAYKYMTDEEKATAINSGSEMAHILKRIYLDESSMWYKSPAIQHLLAQFFDAIHCGEC